MKQRWKHWCNRLIIDAASLESFPLSAFFSLSSEDQAVASVNVILLSKLIGQPHSADGACALVHNAHALLCNMRMRKCSLCSAACRVQHLAVRWRSSRLGDQIERKPALVMIKSNLQSYRKTWVSNKSLCSWQKESSRLRHHAFFVFFCGNE